MRELEVQRSTLSDSPAELRDLGYVSSPERLYLPGPRLLTFVRRAASSGDLTAGVRPALQALVATTGETAVYVMEKPGRGAEPMTVIAMDQVESRHPIRYVADIGEPWPVHSTAAGQVFLAFADGATRERTYETLRSVDPEALEAERVRTRGYAMVVDLTRSAALATAVRDVHGHVIGVISVVGPADRLTDAGDVWPSLHDAAAQLGAPAPGEPRPDSPAVAQG